MFSNQNGPEGDLFSKSIAEVEVLFEEAVTIKRLTGSTGGDDSGGVAVTPTYTQIATTANITALEAKEIMFSNATYALGDVRAEFQIPVYGPETYTGDLQTAGRGPDQVIYRGRIYKIVGHVMQVNFEGIQYWQAVLRQVG
jgi:hypothetical protein